MLSLVVVVRRLVRALRTGFADPAFRGTVQLAAIVVFAGTLFYARVEDWRLFEAFYFCITTLTTIGFGDITPQTLAGRAFTVGYVLLGLGVMVSLVTQIAGHAIRRNER